MQMIGLFTGYLRRMKGLSKDKDIYISVTGRINDRKMPDRTVCEEFLFMKRFIQAAWLTLVPQL
jgi:hypothetical protein